MADATIYAKRFAELPAALDALRAGGNPQDRATAVTQVMGILGALAANAPTPQLRESWLSQYRQLQPEAAKINALAARALAESGGNEYFGPDWLLGPLDKLSTAVLKFGNNVLEGVGGVVQGTGAAVSGLGKVFPLLLILVLVAGVVVVVMVGPQLLKARKGK